MQHKNASASSATHGAVNIPAVAIDWTPWCSCSVLLESPHCCTLRLHQGAQLTATAFQALIVLACCDLGMNWFSAFCYLSQHSLHTRLTTHHSQGLIAGVEYVSALWCCQVVASCGSSEDKAATVSLPQLRNMLQPPHAAARCGTATPPATCPGQSPCPWRFATFTMTLQVFQKPAFPEVLT